MAQFKSILPNVEVNGQTVLSVVNGLGVMKSMGKLILSENGIINPTPEGWYSQQKWLNAFKQISENIGVNLLIQIGSSIPDNAIFPPHINSVHKALESINIAYHMNHRLNNTVLFNPSTGQMFEGIGHYKYQKISETSAEITCDNPYPCDFDKGLIKAMTLKFLPKGITPQFKHDEVNSCRKKGDVWCRYLISW